MNKPLLSLKGAAMGIAEVIPGVSGGTIAFITGIYERLLNAIKAFDIALIKMVFRGRLKEMWKHIDGNFLFFLIIGMACGIGIGVFGVSYLMENYPEVLYGFFFGLIAASAWYIGRQVTKWTPGLAGILLVGGVIAFLITQVSPAEGNVNPGYIILSGFLAVSALMLPGISGSFILLLLGMYPVIIGTLKGVLSGHGFSEIWILACFALGMAIGLIAFSRALTWMFKHYHQVTLALLAGFMVGSLPKIWPWRVPVRWMDEEGLIRNTGIPDPHARILTDKVVMPGGYNIGDPQTLAVVLAIIGGIVAILGAMYIEKKMLSKKSNG